MATPIPLQTFYTRVPDPRSLSSAHVTLQSCTHPIILRTPTKEDTPGLTAVMMNPANTASDGSVSKMSPKELHDLVCKWLILTDPLNYLNMVILLNGKVVGVTGLGYIYSSKGKEKDEEKEKVLQNDERIGVAGVVINPHICGKGFAAEALRIVIDYGLRETGLCMIRLGTSSKNKAMVNLMKFGYGMWARLRTRINMEMI